MGRDKQTNTFPCGRELAELLSTFLSWEFQLNQLISILRHLIKRCSLKVFFLLCPGLRCLLLELFRVYSTHVNQSCNHPGKCPNTETNLIRYFNYFLFGLPQAGVFDKTPTFRSCDVSLIILHVSLRSTLLLTIQNQTPLCQCF